MVIVGSAVDAHDPEALVKSAWQRTVPAAPLVALADAQPCGPAGRGNGLVGARGRARGRRGRRRPGRRRRRGHRDGAGCAEPPPAEEEQAAAATAAAARSAADGGTFVIDGQGPAPAAATPAAFGALGIDLIPGNGLLAATVPAAFGAWLLLLQRYGTLRLRDIMTYAIGYAGDGYPMLRGASAAIEAMAPTFAEHWPTSAEVYLSAGTPAPGSRFANKALAATYGRILAEAEAAGDDRDAQIEAARRAWHEGFVAEAIDAFTAGTEVMDVTGRANRGLLTGADMAAWRASVEEPSRLGFRGLTVCKTGPWGQGPVFCQQLAMLDGFDLPGLGAGSAELIHTITEVAKLAFADREAWYGDPRHSDVPLADLH